MNYKSFLIKYAEIGVKGKNRYLFEDALVKQINQRLKRHDDGFMITKEQGRIYAEASEDYDFDEVINALQHVFGIVGICPMVQVEKTDFESLKEEVAKYIDEAYEDKNFTFKVEEGRHPCPALLNGQTVSLPSHLPVPHEVPAYCLHQRLHLCILFLPDCQNRSHRWNLHTPLDKMYET